MAKYKFTKTFKISEGICINADGTVTKLIKPFVPSASKPVEKKTSLRIHISDKTSYQKKPSVKSKYNKSGLSYQRKSVLPGLKPSVKDGKQCQLPKITISLDDPNNPYYQEGVRHKRKALALSSAPRTRGAFGGVQILKPINGLAAGALKGCRG